MNPISAIQPIAIFAISRSLASSPDALRILLEALSRWSFWSLLFTTAVVVGGVVLEWPETWKTYKEWKTSEDKSKSRIPLLSLIGLLLVILGVTGEGFFEGALGLVDAKLRNLDSQHIVQVDGEAQRALDSARAAQSSAAEGLAAAKRASDDAARDAKEARKGLALAGPRTVLLEKNRAVLVAQLSRFRGQKVRLEYETDPHEPQIILPADTDTGTAVLALRSLLMSAGWDTPMVEFPSRTHGTGGVFVAHGKRASKRTVEATAFLMKSLAAIPMIVYPWGFSPSPSDIAFPTPVSMHFTPEILSAPYSPMDDDTILVTVMAHP